MSSTLIKQTLDESNLIKQEAVQWQIRVILIKIKRGKRL